MVFVRSLCKKEQGFYACSKCTNGSEGYTGQSVHVAKNITTPVAASHTSHIIINSYSLSGKKYYANRKSLKRIREISDGVCLAFGLKPNPNLTGKGRSINHKEWEHRKNGTSWKEQIRQEIDSLIGSANSLDELLQTG